MKSKKAATARKWALLQMELDIIKENMGRAMQNAYPGYVTAGRITPAMQDVLYGFYLWARRYEEARK